MDYIDIFKDFHKIAADFHIFPLIKSTCQSLFMLLFQDVTVTIRMELVLENNELHVRVPVIKTQNDVIAIHYSYLEKEM